MEFNSLLQHTNTVYTYLNRCDNMSQIITPSMLCSACQDMFNGNSRPCLDNGGVHLNYAGYKVHHSSPTQFRDAVCTSAISVFGIGQEFRTLIDFNGRKEKERLARVPSSYQISCATALFPMNKGVSVLLACPPLLICLG
jgi:hypothetical protein